MNGYKNINLLVCVCVRVKGGGVVGEGILNAQVQQNHGKMHFNIE